MQDEASSYIVSSRGVLKSCSIRNAVPRSSDERLDPGFTDSFKSGDSIYVCTEALLNFSTTYFDRIDGEFILFSGDSDLSVSDKLISRPEISRMINSGRLKAWYAQNLEVHNEKLRHLPIGLDFHTCWEKPGLWGLSKQTVFAQEHSLLSILAASPAFQNRHLISYGNFRFTANRGDRAECIERVDKGACYFEAHPLPRLSSWQRMSQFMFVLSPEGYGHDCHRTWEAIALGCIPIVKKSGFTSIFDGLPVWVVDDWSEVNKENMILFARETLNKTFDYSQLFMGYWRRLAAAQPTKEGEKCHYSLEQFKSVFRVHV